MQSVKDAARARELEAIQRWQAQQIAASAQTLQAPIVALLRRIERNGVEVYDGMSTLALSQLAIRAARAMGVVIQGERLVHGLSTENVDAHLSGDRAWAEARRQVNAMTPLERERFLLGEGFADGRDKERREAAERAAQRGAVIEGHAEDV